MQGWEAGPRHLQGNSLWDARPALCSGLAAGNRAKYSCEGEERKAQLGRLGSSCSQKPLGLSVLQPRSSEGAGELLAC